MFSKLAKRFADGNLIVQILIGIALGAVIAPPVLGYYSAQNSLEDMENFIIGKWLDLLGLKHQIYKRWS